MQIQLDVMVKTLKGVLAVSKHDVSPVAVWQPHETQTTKVQTHDAHWWRKLEKIIVETKRRLDLFIDLLVDSLVQDGNHISGDGLWTDLHVSHHC